MQNPYVTSSKEYKTGFLIGQAVAGAANGLKTHEVLHKAAFVREAEKNTDIQRIAAATGAWIFERAGLGGSFEHVALCKLASTETPVSQCTHDTFISPVLSSLAYFRKAAETNMEEAVTMEKEAAPGWAFTAIPSITGKTVGSLPAAVKLLALLGIGGGLAGGGLSWALNRSATQDDADVEAKEEQAAHYRRIAEDIKKRIQLERDKNPETKAVEEASGTYVV